MKKDNVKNLDKKLLGYSLAAGAILAGGRSFAAVQHSDPPDISIYAWGVFPVAFPVGTEYFYLYSSFFSSYYSALAYPYNGLANAGTFPYVKALNTGQQVGPGLNFGNIPFLGSTSAGNFPNAGQKCIGVLYNDVDGVHYGWIRVSVTLPPSPGFAKITIHDWAYEDTANRPVLAGTQTSLNVQLNQFTACLEPDGVNLNWATQSEIDNLGFVLERRELDNAGNVINDWSEIASYLTHVDLQGQGNTSEETLYSFTDQNMAEGAIYEYQLIDVNVQGNRNTSLSLNIKIQGIVPDEMTLGQNYPNPFNPRTTIKFGIPEADRVTLSVYNLKGQTIDHLINEHLPAGYHEIPWDGSPFPAGVYFYELRAGDRREVRKLNLIK
ncbi:T9SS type A sorting domain-containing protein [bacterium]|nr:T9SS type A sorting domain-containing protein [bacterium]